MNLNETAQEIYEGVSQLDWSLSDVENTLIVFRAQILRDAADVCYTVPGEPLYGGSAGRNDIATAIRALKEKP